jgi:hypothetical protein
VLHEVEMRGSGKGTIVLAATVKRLEGELQLERQKRRLAEQKAAGLRSTVVRMQALIARKKAEDAERRAEG